MAKVRKIDFSPDEYLSGTMGMKHAERGLYWQVCALIYSAGREIHETDERLFRGTADNSRTTRALLAELISRGKIERSPSGELMVKRCRKELESASERMRRSAEAGSKGGRPAARIEENQRVKKPEAFSAEKPPSSPSSPPSNNPASQDADASLKSRIFGPALEWLERQTGKNANKLRPLVGRWCSKFGDGVTLEAINAAAKEAPLDPIPYIEKILSAEHGSIDGGRRTRPSAGGAVAAARALLDRRPAPPDRDGGNGVESFSHQLRVVNGGPS